ncbi:hypothetical protein [Circovirus-like genome DHCV-3]|uniref:hypothetical protein n=1 Tax=Circovirus-like genome DHCV-3 TaxID=1788452 RepID=UPI0007F9D601|nr:hypothetical protein [Circovirus-like genome DHCV-3]AMB43002.1 hypothetical protein [Circovirus-like genome DHCV-3]
MAEVNYHAPKNLHLIPIGVPYVSMLSIHFLVAPLSYNNSMHLGGFHLLFLYVPDLVTISSFSKNFSHSQNIHNTVNALFLFPLPLYQSQHTDTLQIIPGIPCNHHRYNY